MWDHIVILKIKIRIKLSIGESKTVTLHCISESGERIDPDRDYDTNDQPVLLYSNNIEVDRLHGIYSGLYDIDEYTQTMKITYEITNTEQGDNS